ILAGPPGENVGLKESFRIGDQQGNIYTEPYRATEYGLPCGANVKIIPGISNGRINTCLKKPIIFVEGIDFGFQNHPSGCYGGKCGEIGLIDLQYGKIYNPYETKSSKQYESWQPLNLAPLFLDKLKDRKSTRL